MDAGLTPEQFLEQCKTIEAALVPILEPAPTSLQIAILFRRVLAATNGVPCEQWVPMLSSFLAGIAHRDGILVCSHEGDEEEAPVMH